MAFIVVHCAPRDVISFLPILSLLVQSCLASPSSLQADSCAFEADDEHSSSSSPARLLIRPWRAPSKALFGRNGNVCSDLGCKSGVERGHLHIGHWTTSCQSPQLRCRREKNHFKMQVAQKECPHDGERRVYGDAIISKQRGQLKFSSRFLNRCWDAAVLYSLTKSVSSSFSRITLSSCFPRAVRTAGLVEHR